jgi:chromosome segregation ATPase
LTKLEGQKKSHQKIYDELNESWCIKLNQSIQELRHKFTKESEKAVEFNKQQIKFEMNQKTDKLTDYYEKELDKLNSQIKNKTEELLQINAKVNMLQYENDQLNTIVQELREELKGCIDYFATIKNGDTEAKFKFKWTT